MSSQKGFATARGNEARVVELLITGRWSQARVLMDLLFVFGARLVTSLEAMSIVWSQVALAPTYSVRMSIPSQVSRGPRRMMNSSHSHSRADLCQPCIYLYIYIYIEDTYREDKSLWNPLTHKQERLCSMETPSIASTLCYDSLPWCRLGLRLRSREQSMSTVMF